LIAKEADFDIDYRERTAVLLLEDGLGALLEVKTPGDYWDRWESAGIRDGGEGLENELDGYAAG